jgi:hypothetical protein
LFIENLLHPDFEELPSAFFIEISSGDFFRLILVKRRSGPARFRGYRPTAACGREPQAFERSVLLLSRRIE